MKRLFIITPEFDKLWKVVKNDDEELRLLQNHLLINPKEGKVISGTSGLRKLRWSFKGKGKSGGLRILYPDIEESEIIFLISLLKKNEKENLSESDKKLINKNIKFIKLTLK
ncbi:MAG TPA: hypothetical protein PKA90_13725 [Ignavibacteria bacterium]|nr:hypothetical protein [Ignavibacteria bacterium]HMR41478.1 hypothetical protein [Ignavibacteria bacterium]